MSRTKYNNKRVVVDGQIYDSEGEYLRWCDLKLMERAGEISGLKRQVRYKLLPTQYVNKKCVERGVDYIPDFVYTENGATVCEDFKGKKTEAYIIKRKLMLYIHGIMVRETSRGNLR